ncbi:DUF11 domain-containing protein [Lysobacter maris]|uniref:DUF11 domain-containing protein n=1 Tax=Marilutibacter maris TaxID=1605891 RepID=A0A508ATY7_9GAMM|nr:DUF11 domain-containing protein [Lysobacter maris]KAB8189110.1 DUF11 domain-containing protein [Lysobacter maris]
MTIALATAAGLPAIAHADQWMTNATGTAQNNGQQIDITFGNGVTAFYRQTANFNVTGCGPGNAIANGIATRLSGTNVNAYIEPNPPAGSARVGQCLRSGIGRVDHRFRFNKPVIDPTLHLVNLDASDYIVNGSTISGGAITPQVRANNNVMQWSGATLPRTFNTATVNAVNAGCQANNGTNPRGRCGSFRLNGVDPIVTWTAANRPQSIDSADGWAWSVSFQLARLTKAFAPAVIAPGGVSTLTFTIDNTNATNGTNPATATALTPLDFTDLLPTGLTVANSNVSSTCPNATFRDASGGALGAGDTGLRVTGFRVGVDATCTLTVNVTANAPGVYLNNTGNMTSSIGNLVLAPNATLTVPNTIVRLRKALPDGRAIASDQFTLSIAGTGGPAIATTTGSTNAPVETAVIDPATAGDTYSLSETGAAGADLGNYVTGYACTNALAGGQAPSGTGTSFDITAALGDDLTCTFSNRRRQADLTISKTNTPAAGPDDQAGDTLVAGTTTTYTLAVTNNGPDAVDGAVVTDTPVAGLNCPAGNAVTITGAGVPAGSFTVADLTGAGIALGALAVGETAVLSFNCNVL